jgi:transposase
MSCTACGPGSVGESATTTSDVLIPPWPGAHPTKHMGQTKEKDWRPELNQNRAYSSRQSFRSIGTASLSAPNELVERRCWGMAKPVVADDLWTAVAPLLPPERPKPKGGRPRLPDRAALTGIVLVLTAGAAWERRPVERGCGSGMTCWRRLRDWQTAGVWSRLHRVLLERLQAAEAIDWSRAALDSASIGAKREARRSAPIRRTAVSPAPSATLSRTPAARRWT